MTIESLNEYDIGVKYTVEHLTGYKVFAASEEQAIAIAKAIHEKKFKNFTYHGAKAIKL